MGRSLGAWIFAWSLGRFSLSSLESVSFRSSWAGEVRSSSFLFLSSFINKNRPASIVISFYTTLGILSICLFVLQGLGPVIVGSNSLIFNVYSY